MCGFYCTVFIEVMVAEKTFLDSTNLFSPNDYERMTKLYASVLKVNMVEQESLKFRLRRIDKTRSLLEQIKHNDLMSEKYKKTCKSLKYTENLLILVSTGTGAFQFLHLLH